MASVWAPRPRNRAQDQFGLGNAARARNHSHPEPQVSRDAQTLERPVACQLLPMGKPRIVAVVHAGCAPRPIGFGGASGWWESAHACKAMHVCVACSSGSDILSSALTHSALCAQSCCLILFGLLGHAIKWSNDAKVQTEIMQSCNWAAITCIVGVKRTAAAQSLAFAVGSVNMDAQALQQFVLCVVSYDGSNIMPSHPSVDLGFQL